MNLLAFDTSTETMSIAVLRESASGDVVHEHESAGGAQASTGLIPAIQQMLADTGLQLADLDAVVFGRGPGSFTGLRTACSVAQGLAFGSGVFVLPVETLLAVAEAARAQAGVERVVAVLDARMDEVYWGAYEFAADRWQRVGEISLGAPESVVLPPGWALAGNALATHSARLPQAAVRVEALPGARAMLRVAPALIAAGEAGSAATALPLYIRDKVALTTDERAALRGATAPSR